MALSRAKRIEWFIYVVFLVVVAVSVGYVLGLGEGRVQGYQLARSDMAHFKPLTATR